MPNKKHYHIPQGDHEFLDRTTNFVQVATENAVPRDLSPTDISVIKAKADDFAQKVEKTIFRRSRR